MLGCCEELNTIHGKHGRGLVTTSEWLCLFVPYQLHSHIDSEQPTEKTVSHIGLKIH